MYSIFFPLDYVLFLNDKNEDLIENFYVFCLYLLNKKPVQINYSIRSFPLN